MELGKPEPRKKLKQMSETRNVQVPEGLEGERLDSAMARMFGLSRTKAADLIDAGSVQLNCRSAIRSDKVKTDDWVEVVFPEVVDQLEVKAEVISGLTIVYDDDDFVVVDKPAGIAAHPSQGWDGPTVVGGLAGLGYRITSHGAPERQGIVQRLDVGTSGLMVVAKSERAYSSLKQQFRDRTPVKVYHAVVHGRLDPMIGTIDAPIGRHPNHDFKFAVMTGGRDSVTHYETLEAMAHASLLEIHLETGRTHQIRVHMAAMRHPCVGDEMYGSDPTLAAKLGLNRQWLHAVELEIEHPSSGQRVRFRSEYPADLQNALEILRG
jgi:23S rRNA pseudouridine1911/1915/1917 synthase